MGYTLKYEAPIVLTFEENIDEEFMDVSEINEFLKGNNLEQVADSMYQSNKEKIYEIIIKSIYLKGIEDERV